MDMTGRDRVRGGPLAASRALLRTALVVAAAGLALPALGANASAAFRVNVDLLTEFKSVVQCDRTSIKNEAGETVNVTCVDEGRPAVAAPAQRDPRFLLHLWRGGGAIGTVEGLTPPGTVTSWRVINAANRDYLEIVVGW